MGGPAMGSIGWFEFGSDHPTRSRSSTGAVRLEVRAQHGLARGELPEITTAPGQPSSGGVFESGAVPDSRSSTSWSKDVAATVAQAKGLGAEVTMAPVTDAAGITFGRLRDTAGNHFGVFSPPAG